jgi:acyl-CoA synthetase (AMP-forming)/AMP-acid ligase II
MSRHPDDFPQQERPQQLFSLLDRTTQETPDAPCAVFVSTDGESNTGTLTYREARAALLQHQTWLGDQLNALKKQLMAKRSSRSLETEDVVVAYLSNNSVDLFLSVLACTSDQVPGLPVLLHTRWTFQEMTNCLESINKSAITLLLYGQGFQESAARVKALQHTVLCRRIPTLDKLLRRCLHASFPVGTLLWSLRREPVVAAAPRACGSVTRPLPYKRLPRRTIHANTRRRRRY